MSSSVTQIAGSGSMSQAEKVFFHGTTSGESGKFIEAKVGLVFKAAVPFFVVRDASDKCCDAFAFNQRDIKRDPAKQDPVVLTICPTDPKGRLEGPNAFGHVFFEEGTQLRIEAIRKAIQPPRDFHTTDWCGDGMY